MKYDARGVLIPDLAENYAIGDNGKIYDIFLKQNIKWHNGEKLSADDVIFTIKLIQSPDYKSPLRISWLGVDVIKLDEYTIRFELKNAYAPFLHNLTFGILPKHIWKNVSAANFPLNKYNLQPIGSGPFKFKKIKKDKENNILSLELESFKDYYSGHRPYIKTLRLNFYPSEANALSALKKQEIDGFGFLSAKNINQIKNDFIKIYNLNLPRYFAIFLNQTENKILSDQNVRLALNYATDKQEIIERVLNNHGIVADSPILPKSFGYNPDIKIYQFDLEQAKSFLEKGGWKKIDETGVRRHEKDEEAKLEFDLLTAQWPELVETTNLLKEQWEKIGFRVNIEIKDISDIQQEHIRPRQYQALLFGEVLGLDPDPFAFWHSSQKKDPGLNLALYDNRKVDQLLEEARQDLNPETRIKKYTQFQELLISDAPAIFLYSPNYFYVLNKKIKGFTNEIVATPAQRFTQIETWYIKSKRNWK